MPAPHRGSQALRGPAHETLQGTKPRETVLQINTQGGVHSGPCDKASSLYSAPYSADYVFLQKGG